MSKKNRAHSACSQFFAVYFCERRSCVLTEKPVFCRFCATFVPPVPPVPPLVVSQITTCFFCNLSQKMGKKRLLCHQIFHKRVVASFLLTLTLLLFVSCELLVVKHLYIYIYLMAQTPKKRIELDTYLCQRGCHRGVTGGTAKQQNFKKQAHIRGAIFRLCHLHGFLPSALYALAASRFLAAKVRVFGR